MMTTNLSAIANVKQLRTGGIVFRILLPFFPNISWCWRPKFRNFLIVCTIGLSSAQFCRAFGTQCQNKNWNIFRSSIHLHVALTASHLTSFLHTTMYQNLHSTHNSYSDNGGKHVVWVAWCRSNHDPITNAQQHTQSAAVMRARHTSHAASPVSPKNIHGSLPQNVLPPLGRNKGNAARLGAGIFNQNLQKPGAWLHPEKIPHQVETFFYYVSQNLQKKTPGRRGMVAPWKNT